MVAWWSRRFSSSSSVRCFCSRRTRSLRSDAGREVVLVTSAQAQRLGLCDLTNLLLQLPLRFNVVLLELVVEFSERFKVLDRNPLLLNLLGVGGKRRQRRWSLSI